MTDTTNARYEFMVNNNIATDSELNMAIKLIGFSCETLDAVTYVTTGYKTLEQYIESECLDWNWDKELESMGFLNLIHSE